jgi:intracellular sulfur oxidation DsrE/DsrF family protein
MHMQDDQGRAPRRVFLGQLGLLAVAGTAPLTALQAQRTPATSGSSPWDMSWVDRVAPAPYKAVIDATKLEGDALYTAMDLMDRFHEVYDTRDDQTRLVVVMRHSGAAMGLSDALWDRYAIGEERNVTDPATKAPARRNPFLRAAPNDHETWEINGKIEPLVARGVTVLVCNRAAMGLASSLAKKSNKPLEEVQADIRGGLVPGAALMPTGIFALVRAQNAGCALYRAEG